MKVAALGPPRDTMKAQAILKFNAIACLFASTMSLADTHGMVMSGTIYVGTPSTCQSHENAEAEAEKLALKSSQTYCRSEGYGWQAASVKHLGNLDCEACGNNQITCSYSKIALECHKAKPILNWLAWFSGKP